MFGIWIKFYGRKTSFNIINLESLIKKQRFCIVKLKMKFHYAKHHFAGFTNLDSHLQ